MGIRSADKSWQKIAVLMAVFAPALGCTCASPHAAEREGIAQGGHEIVAALQSCRAIKDNKTRLGCFDDVARKNAPPKFSGKLGYKTDPFQINRPHVLRYRSKGVIFVLYLLDEKGEVIQNLHIGGGGEDTYLIEQTGTYSLQIDGSAGWKIWLDPVEPDQKPKGIRNR